MINVNEIKNIEETREQPAFGWRVGFKNNHTPDEDLDVSYSDLKNSEVGDTWELNGDWDEYNAVVMFIDENGALVRFGHRRYDEEYFSYRLEYFHFV